MNKKPYHPDPASAGEFAGHLAATAWALYDACLVGNATPSVAARFEWLTHPEPGNLVLEISRRLSSPGDALGRLLFIAGIRPQTDEEWVEAEADGRWRLSYRHDDPYWYIDPLDGSQRTAWTNCTFIRVPEAGDPPLRVS